MNDIVRSGDRIDRKALERIIQRAAELQTKDREIGEYLTESELMQLGDEVGISAAHLRKALEEERGRALTQGSTSRLTWLIGPRMITAQRTVAGRPKELTAALHKWFSEGELLQVKRRLADRTSWERKEGTFASIQRSLGFSSKRYLLARTREVGDRIIEIDEKECYVELTADITNTFNEYLWGSGMLLAGSVAVAGIALVLGVMVPVAIVPALLGPVGSVAIARSRHSHVDKLRVALEQVLDRLEHGELDIKRRPRVSTTSAVGRIADEIRKNLGGMNR